MSGVKTKPGGASGALLNYVSLFSSVGTLLCCALPSLLVLVGLGATVASFLSSVPWMVTLSRHKNWVFVISGILIASNFLYVYSIAPRLRSRDETCLPEAPDACNTAGRTSKIVLWISLGIYGVGVFSAYVLGRLLMKFG